MDIFVDDLKVDYIAETAISSARANQRYRAIPPILWLHTLVQTYRSCSRYMASLPLGLVHILCPSFSLADSLARAACYVPTVLQTAMQPGSQHDSM